MRIIKILSLCLVLVLFSTVFAAGKASPQVEFSKKARVQNDFPKIFRPVGNFFKRLFKRKKNLPANQSSANVVAIEFSRTEVVMPFATSDNSCAEPPLVEVATAAGEPEGIVLTFVYTVAAGRIIGEGANVIWDLSGVEPGTYQDYGRD